MELKHQSNRIPGLLKVSGEEQITVFTVNLIFVTGSPALFQHSNPIVKRPGGWETILVFTSVSDRRQVCTDLIKVISHPRE